jgi:hypothetical protein
MGSWHAQIRRLRDGELSHLGAAFSTEVKAARAHDGPVLLHELGYELASAPDYDAARPPSAMAAFVWQSGAHLRPQPLPPQAVAAWPPLDGPLHAQLQQLQQQLLQELQQHQQQHLQQLQQLWQPPLASPPPAPPCAERSQPQARPGELSPRADAPSVAQTASAPFGVRSAALEPALEGRNKFLGVHGTRDGQWIARINLDGEQVHLGAFASAVEAARAYDALAAPLNRRLNFPPRQEPAFTPFKGTTLRAGAWVAQIYINGDRVHLGTFSSAIEAACAYDAAAAPLKRALNFLSISSTESPGPTAADASQAGTQQPQAGAQPQAVALGGLPVASAPAGSSACEPAPKRRKLHRFKGIRATPAGRWAAQIMTNGKTVHLGMFSSAIRAARAYDAAAAPRNRRLNFPPSSCAQSPRAPAASVSPSGAQQLQPGAQPQAIALGGLPVASAPAGSSACEPAPKRHKLHMFKGICATPAGRWSAKIMTNGKTVHLGMFSSAIRAARAYDAAAAPLNRRLNFSLDSDAAQRPSRRA